MFVACQIAYTTAATRTVKLGHHVKPENTAYIYQSVVESYLKYEAAKQAEELGLTRAGDANHVCYDGYGCFFKNGTYGNFYRLPASPKVVSTKFYLYRSADQEDPELLDYKNMTSLFESSFRGDQPTVITIHGFSSGPWAEWGQPMRAAVFRAVSDFFQMEMVGNFVFTFALANCFLRFSINHRLVESFFRLLIVFSNFFYLYFAKCVLCLLPCLVEKT